MTAMTHALAPKKSAWYSKAVPGTYVAVVCFFVFAAFVYKLRIDGIFACPASGYGSDAYLSDCTARSFGDYDHGAFWFGLEPQAQHAASRADVLFIGNSRLQFALSGQRNEERLTALGGRHFLLGFSHSESVAYFGPLLAKLQPRAKVYVLNVDRLFDDRVSPPTEQILNSSDARQRYQDKLGWQTVHKSVCGTAPRICGDSLAVYRNRFTGNWQRIGAAPFSAQPVSEGSPSNAERWDRYAELAEAFIARLPVERSCIILTLVPTVQTKRSEAEAIAARLRIPLISPRVEGLRTFDGSHLDEASAERWSAALLDASAQQIRQCVRAAPQSS
jgi:hypothetical protein